MNLVHNETSSAIKCIERYYETQKEAEISTPED